MKKHSYQRLRDEEKANAQQARKAQEAAEDKKIEKFFDDSFITNFNSDRNGVTNEHIKRKLTSMIEAQGVKVPANAFTYLNEDVLLPKLATHLHIYRVYGPALAEAYEGISAKKYLSAFSSVAQRLDPAKAEEALALNWALKLSNPYVLRFHVMALHNIMHSMMVTHKNANDPVWQSLQQSVLSFARNCQGYLLPLKENFPATYYLLNGYNHYTLAMGKSGDEAKAHWKSAYEAFLLCEATAKHNPKASFIVNLGKGTFKDFQFDNLSYSKAEVCTFLTADEQLEIENAVKSEVAEFLPNKSSLK